MCVLLHLLLQKNFVSGADGKGLSRAVRLDFLALLALVFTMFQTLADPLAVTGQWDFKLGDLRATIGSDLQYVGDTSNITSFTIAKINGQQANVMGFGSNSSSQGFIMRHGAAPNGGGQFVNQYTLIMDVLYPGGDDSSAWLPLVQADPFNHSGNDAEFYFGVTTTPGPDGIGPASQMTATLLPNTWYRLGLVVDLTAQAGKQLRKYLNGTPVGMQNLSGGIDGRYALGPSALLFTTGFDDPNNPPQPGYVNSIQFINGCVAPADMAALGGPSPQGIPYNDSRPSIQVTAGNWQSPSLKLAWTGRSGSMFDVQITPDLSNPNWQTIGTFSAEDTVTVAASTLAGSSGFLRVAGSPSGSAIPGAVREGAFVVGRVNGAQSLPTKQLIRTSGQSLRFSGRAVDIALSPDGTLAFIKNNLFLQVVDTASWRVLQSLRYPGSAASMSGIAVNPAGTHVYVTGLGNELYDYTISANRSVALSRTISLPAAANPSGVAISADGSNAFVCLTRQDYLVTVNLATTNITKSILVGVAPWDVVLSPDGNTAYVSNWGGRHPVKGDLVGSSINEPIVVDERGVAASGTVSVVDLSSNTEVMEIATGLHPSAEALSQDGSTLYVANANSDTVTVINTQMRAVQETIVMKPDPALPTGSACDGLALSPDGKQLYVANGGNNAVGIVELPNGQHTNSLILGFVPTDWYPSAVVADSSNLYVANIKGLGSGSAVTTFLGSATKIPLPTQAVLNKLTAQVQNDGRVPHILRAQTPPQTNVVPVPVPARAGEPSVFQHVLYVIKENKTYDQMFGDIPQGNGNSNLCVYPKFVTPNHHALATQFVLLDNYYCNGVFSTDGHSWCTEANSTDYWEKSLGTINRAVHQGTDPLMYTSSGFIWDNVLRHNLTMRNYGVMGESYPQPSTLTWLQVYADYTNHAGKIKFNTYIGAPPVLPKYSSTGVSGFNLSIPDQLRADGFIAELNAAQSNGNWPTFNMFYLPNDHTAGTSPGYPSPRAQLADNDLALGRVVEAVSKSIFWTNTVIFVIEDDPQSGFDHVDGHRSICLVISPYTKRGQTISTFYNQVGVVHTMEQIMGLPPMNQMDSMGPLMADCFMATPNFTPYTALAVNIALNEMNAGTTSSLSRKDRYWAQLSQKQDFSKPDVADDNTLNHIIWHAMKGDARYPSEFTGSHGKGLKKLGLILAKSVKGDDDD